jgi:dUTP pyrophosphatase
MKIELKILPHLQHNPHFDLNQDTRNYRYYGPSYAKPGDAGMDIRACIDAPIELLPGDTVLIPTGLAFYGGSIWNSTELYNDDDTVVALTLVPRSGLGHKHGIILGNTIGVIDEGYQNETFISAYNRSKVAYTIQPAERICQIMVMPVVKAEWQIVDEFSGTTERGLGGFGSTGVL